MDDSFDANLELALDKLEFDEIRARLTAQCLFPATSEIAAALEPSSDRWLVDRWLEATAEGVDLLTNFPDITIGGARDVRASAERAGSDTHE